MLLVQSGSDKARTFTLHFGDRICFFMSCIYRQSHTSTWSRTIITSINDSHDQRNKTCSFGLAQCPIGNSDLERNEKEA